MPKRKAEEVTDEAEFRSYKIDLVDADGWNFREWCKALLDPAHEYLAVTHTQGKDGKFHGHLVCWIRIESGEVVLTRSEKIAAPVLAGRRSGPARTGLSRSESVGDTPVVVGLRSGDGDLAVVVA
jgi:hypothetical protein